MDRGRKACIVWAQRACLIAVVAAVSIYLTMCCIVVYRNVHDAKHGGDGGMALAAEGGGHASLRFAAAAAAAAGSTNDEALTEAEQHARIRAELGHGTWNMLHRVAAKFDKDPTPERRAEVAHFFDVFSHFYPCEECAGHFRGMLAEHPIDARSNKHLSLWLCKLHNIVNERLHKPAFPCTLEALAEKYGDCGCFDGPEGEKEGKEGGGSSSGGAAAAVAGKRRLLQQHERSSTTTTTTDAAAAGVRSRSGRPVLGSLQQLQRHARRA